MFRAHLLAAAAAAMFLFCGCGDSGDGKGAPGSGEPGEVRTALDPGSGAIGARESATDPAKSSSSVTEAKTIEPPRATSPGKTPADTVTAGKTATDAATGKAAAPPSSRTPKDWSSLTLDVPFVIGYEKGLAEIRTKRKPGMFLVVTSWCKFSKELAEKNFRDPEIKNLLDRFVCVLVDAEAEPIAAGQLGAQGYPFIVFRGLAGNTLLSLGGALETAAFKQSINQALALHAGKSS